MNTEWRASFVTAVDLLHAAIDAIEHTPHDTLPESQHPQDAWCDASNALDIVAGERIALTDRARHPRRTAPILPDDEPLRHPCE